MTEHETTDLSPDRATASEASPSPGAPLVSVVMTVYNDADFVVDAVSSILGQTFSEFEFIIVDDGAIDDSVAKVRQFTDSRIRLIRQGNAGLAAALNQGIREARGTLIARQDADDVSSPERLERQVRVLQEHPAIGVVGCNSRIVDEQGNILRVTDYPLDDAELQRMLIGDSGSTFTHGNVMFRKSVAQEVGLYRPEFKRCQDYDLWLRMAEVTQMANLPEPLYTWRHRRTSVGAQDWVGHHDFSRLALWCARQRRQGRPEPELNLRGITRGWFIRMTYRWRTPNDPSLVYDLMSAQDLVRQGRGRDARALLRNVIRKSPGTVYAWLLFLLTFFPGGAAPALWQGMRSLYRAGTWKR